MPQEPTWHAKWCWTQKHLSRPWNSYALFRRDVELRSRPQRAVVRVSADARYTLFVNGRRVHHGPARSFPQFQSYDTFDVSGLLTLGRNAVCVIVHQFGVPTFQSVYRDISGLIVDGQIDVDGISIPLHTPGEWVCRASRAWKKNAARKSVQLGFQEHFDADADPVDWMLPSYVTKAEEGWKPPYVIGPAGVWPWTGMESRGIPLLADRVEDFSSIAAQFRGAAAPGAIDVEDVYHLVKQEQCKPEAKLIDSAAAALRDDSAVATVPALGEDEYALVVLDLGRYRTGHVLLDVAEAAGGEIIDLIYAEAVDRSGFPILVPLGSHCEEATADRYICRAGAQRWETFGFNGLRYLAVAFRNVRTPLKLRRIAIRQVQAAVENRGAFHCSDEQLNRIWEVGRETQRNCLFDAFVDCPWREQAMWWGDARIQAKVTAFAFGDTSILRRGIRLVAQSQGADGSLHAHPPADIPGHRLPDFMMTWVSSLRDYHSYTARGDLVGECLPALKRLMKFLAGHEQQGGLIGGFEGWWVFLDWQELFKRDFSAALNLMYLRTLRDAEALARLAGDESAAQYQQRAAALQASIERSFWDPKANLWRDGFDAATQAQVQQVSQHTNALAILLDLKPEHHASIAREVLVKPARSKRSKVLTGSPFFYAYILEAMIKAGLRDDAIEIVRDKWGRMIDEGGASTFWELWDVTCESRCHAWSASPVYHLAEQVLGVQQVEPGWARVRIAPWCGNVEAAHGRVPTALGVIEVDWERVGKDQLAVRIHVPDGIEADFVTPWGAKRRLVSGLNEFHS